MLRIFNNRILSREYRQKTSKDNQFGAEIREVVHCGNREVYYIIYTQYTEYVWPNIKCTTTTTTAVKDYFQRGNKIC